jgi:hypothetical protein
MVDEKMSERRDRAVMSRHERSGMGDRVVQGTSLENWRTPKSTVGSNPTPSEGPSQEREGGMLEEHRRAAEGTEELPEAPKSNEEHRRVSKSVEVKGG